MLDEAVPPPPHHLSHPSEEAQFENSLAHKAHSVDAEQDHILLESDTAQMSAFDQDIENEVSVPLSAEDTALLTTRIGIPKLDDGVPVHYQHPPLSFNIDAKRQDKLQNALNTVVNVANTKKEEIKREKLWSGKVQNLIKELGEKKLKVENHLKDLSDEIRGVFLKKKKIQNAILQRKLAHKLKKTHNNLKRVRKYSYSLMKQELLYNKHKEQLSHAVENLQHSIALLKGVKRRRNYDLPRKGTADKLLAGYPKLDPDYQTSTMEEQKEVDRLTDFNGKRRG